MKGLQRQYQKFDIQNLKRAINIIINQVSCSIVVLLISDNFEKNFILVCFISVCPFALDIAFLLDTSGSIGNDSYQEMKSFINEVIEHFHISPTGNKRRTKMITILSIYKSV